MGLPEWHVVLISGDRNWYPEAILRREIRALKKKHGSKLIIIVGGAPGVDKMAKGVAHEENVHAAEVDALWTTRHQAAGPQRNTAMLALWPHEVQCYHQDIKKSKGTKDMKTQAEKAGLPVRVISR
jgi:hypothetical protein